VLRAGHENHLTEIKRNGVVLESYIYPSRSMGARLRAGCRWSAGKKTVGGASLHHPFPHREGRAARSVCQWEGKRRRNVRVQATDLAHSMSFARLCRGVFVFAWRSKPCTSASDKSETLAMSGAA
jgi:hypothetical protein